MFKPARGTARVRPDRCPQAALMPAAPRRPGRRRSSGEITDLDRRSADHLGRSDYEPSAASRSSGANRCSTPRPADYLGRSGLQPEGPADHLGRPTDRRQSDHLGRHQPYVMTTSLAAARRARSSTSARSPPDGRGRGQLVALDCRRRRTRASGSCSRGSRWWRAAFRCASRACNAWFSVSDTFFMTSALLFGPGPATVTMALDSMLMSLRSRPFASGAFCSMAARPRRVLGRRQVFFLL